jgi:hypothetical protein
MKPCPTCKKMVANSCQFCPGCGRKFYNSFARFLKWTFGIIFGFIALCIFIGSLSGNHATPITDSRGNAVPDGVTDDASLLIARCGQPSLDDNTAYDNPRPPIPSRWVEYRKQKLRFLFIPGFGATAESAPPYKWKLVGTTDMSASDPSKARVVTPSEAVTRMPCWKSD